MERRALLILSFLTAVAVPAAAQNEAVAPELEVLAPYLGGMDARVPAGGQAALQVPWSLTFSSPVAAAADLGQDDGFLSWDLDCQQHIVLVDASPLAVAHVPGQATYAGTAALAVRASPEAPGLVAITCSFSATFDGAVNSVSSTIGTELMVAFVGNMDVSVPTAKRAAGPQKMIPYPIEITNTGNARTSYTFSLQDRPPGRWNALVPEIAIVEPGQTLIAVFTVATPFENGYNKDDATFTVHIQSRATEDPDVAGPATNVTLGADVHGWYVPGPSPALGLLALASLAALRRRD